MKNMKKKTSNSSNVQKTNYSTANNINKYSSDGKIIRKKFGGYPSIEPFESKFKYDKEKYIKFDGHPMIQKFNEKYDKDELRVKYLKRDPSSVKNFRNTAIKNLTTSKNVTSKNTLNSYNKAAEKNKLKKNKDFDKGLTQTTRTTKNIEKKPNAEPDIQKTLEKAKKIVKKSKELVQKFAKKPTKLSDKIDKVTKKNTDKNIITPKIGKKNINEFKKTFTPDKKLNNCPKIFQTENKDLKFTTKNIKKSDNRVDNKIKINKNNKGEIDYSKVVINLHRTYDIDESEKEKLKLKYKDLKLNDFAYYPTDDKLPPIGEFENSELEI